MAKSITVHPADEKLLGLDRIKIILDDGTYQVEFFTTIMVEDEVKPNPPGPVDKDPNCPGPVDEGPNCPGPVGGIQIPSDPDEYEYEEDSPGK